MEEIAYSPNDNPSDQIKEAQLASYPNETSPSLTDGFPARFIWTREKYYQADKTGIFDKERVELIGGEIIQMAPIGPAHNTVADRLSELLRNVFGDEYRVRWQTSVSINNINEPQPDIAVIHGSWRNFKNRNPLPHEIKLIVEISDSSIETDRRIKTKLYAAAPIPEYWIVNLKENQLEVYRNPEGDSYKEVSIYKSGDSVTPLHATDGAIAISDFLD